MSEIAILVAKVAAPIAAKAAVRGIRGGLRTLDVAWRARKKSRKEGLPIPALWAFRRFLAANDVVGTFASGSVDRLNQLAEVLRIAQLGKHWAPTVEQSQRFLVEVLLAAYTRSLPSNVATEVQVRGALAELKSYIETHETRASSTEFEAALRSMPLPTADSARALEHTWPAVKRFAREFAAASDRRQALRDWVADRPTWMVGAPAPAVLWVAGLAEDLGLRSEAAGLISEALNDGASPAIYWRVRSGLFAAQETVEEQRSALLPYVELHPAARAIVSFLEGEAKSALEMLAQWEPSSPSERAFHSYLSCQLHVATEDYDSAVQIARADLRIGYARPAQYLAERLLVRGNPRTSAWHFQQLETSLSLAIAVRDSLRTWGGPSGNAVVAAMKAAEVLGQSDRAWSLSQVEPRGEATLEEANKKDVKERALLLAAELRPLEEATQLLDSAPDSLARVQGRALLAERHDDATNAVQCWREAIARAVDPEDILGIGYQLARHGIWAAELEQIKDTLPAEVEELRLLASLNAGTPGELEALRGAARQSRPITFGLVSYLQRSEEYRQAALVAADGGERWGDADLWLVAAREYLRTDQPEPAADAARRALQVRIAGWSNEQTAHLVLIEALSLAGRWSEAADAAAIAMSWSPNSAAACWALVTCQIHLGRIRDAWETYTTIGGRPDPRNVREAAMRIGLWREFEVSEESLRVLFELADRWPESREVKLATAFALLFFPGNLSETGRETVRTRLGALMAELPDVFRLQEFDIEDPVGSLDRMVTDLPDTSEVDRQIGEGSLPFGMAASIHHRGLAEVLVCRTTPLFANDSTRLEEEVSVARGVRTTEIVVDVTAVVALTYLDESLATQLMGYPGAVSAPLRQCLDVAEAVESLGHLSTMSVGRSAGGTAVIHRISDEEATTRHRQALEVQSRFDSMRCIERTWSPRVPELGKDRDDFLWAESLDLAFSNPPQALWCDDLRVRQLGIEFGIPVFSTSALIEAMRRDGVVSDDVATHMQAVLITNGLVGGAFNRSLAETAAELEGWRPGGVATYLAWSPPAEQPESRVRFAFEALRHNVDDPSALQDWSSAVAFWLVRVGGEENAEGNLVVLLRMMFSQQWLTADALPFVLAGIRAISSSRELPDPLENALRLHYQALASVIEPRLASDLLSGLFRSAASDDRSLATRIILTGP